MVVGAAGSLTPLPSPRPRGLDFARSRPAKGVCPHDAAGKDEQPARAEPALIGVRGRVHLPAGVGSRWGAMTRVASGGDGRFDRVIDLSDPIRSAIEKPQRSCLRRMFPGPGWRLTQEGGFHKRTALGRALCVPQLVGGWGGPVLGATRLSNLSYSQIRHLSQWVGPRGGAPGGWSRM